MFFENILCKTYFSLLLLLLCIYAETWDLDCKRGVPCVITIVKKFKKNICEFYTNVVEKFLIKLEY